MIGAGVLADGALEGATRHLMAQIRAFIRQLDAALREIGRLDDARAARLVEAIGLTLREPAEPGSVRHVEQAASDVLHTLRGGDA